MAPVSGGKSSIRNKESRGRRRKSPLTTVLVDIVSKSSLGCVSTCEAVKAVLQQWPTYAHGLPLPRLRKRVGDILHRSPCFVPSPAALNHGIRRRFCLAPKPNDQHTSSDHRRVNMAHIIRESNRLMDDVVNRPWTSTEMMNHEALPKEESGGGSCANQSPIDPKQPAEPVAPSLLDLVSPIVPKQPAEPVAPSLLDLVSPIDPKQPAEPVAPSSMVSWITSPGEPIQLRSWLPSHLPCITAGDVAAVLE